VKSAFNWKLTSGEEAVGEALNWKTGKWETSFLFLFEEGQA